MMNPWAPTAVHWLSSFLCSKMPSCPYSWSSDPTYTLRFSFIVTLGHLHALQIDFAVPIWHIARIQLSIHTSPAPKWLQACGGRQNVVPIWKVSFFKWIHNLTPNFCRIFTQSFWVKTCLVLSQTFSAYTKCKRCHHSLHVMLVPIMKTEALRRHLKQASCVAMTASLLPFQYFYGWISTALIKVNIPFVIWTHLSYCLL